MKSHEKTLQFFFHSHGNDESNSAQLVVLQKLKKHGLSLEILDVRFMTDTVFRQYQERLGFITVPLLVYQERIISRDYILDTTELYHAITHIHAFPCQNNILSFY